MFKPKVTYLKKTGPCISYHVFSSDYLYNNEPFKGNNGSLIYAAIIVRNENKNLRQYLICRPRPLKPRTYFVE